MRNSQYEINQAQRFERINLQFKNKISFLKNLLGVI